MKEHNNQDTFARAWQEAFAEAEHAPSPHVWDGIHESLAGSPMASAMADIFDAAEVAPSVEVWDKVETVLAQDEAALYKRKMVWYQRLAAAAIALLLLVGGRTLYQEITLGQGGFVAQEQPVTPVLEMTADIRNNSNVTHANIAETPQGMQEMIAHETSTAKANPSDVVASADDQTSMPVQNIDAATAAMVGSATESYTPASGIHSGSASVRLPADLAFQPQQVVIPEEIDREVYTLTTLSSAVADMGEPIAPSWDRMIYLDPTYVDRESVEEILPQKPSTANTTFASLAMNGGVFNPNYENMLTGGRVYQGLGFVSDQDVSGVVNLESKMRAGLSGGGGMQLGFPVAERWGMILGLNYGNYAVQGTSNYVYEDGERTIPTTTSTLRMLGDAFGNVNSASSEEDYQVTENYQYASIPVQAAFLLLDRKIDVWLLGGANADVFVRNTVISQDEVHTNYSVTAGSENSPYRPILVSGSVGTDVSYQLSDHWSVSVQPTVKMAVTSVAKADQGFVGNPLFLDLGFRLKYHVQ